MIWRAGFAVLLAAGRVETPVGEGGISPTWAESVAVAGMSADATREFTLRLGRSPAKGVASLSLSAVVDGHRYAVADGELGLGDFAGKTPVESAIVSYEVSGPSHARIACRDRDTDAMICVASAEALTHESHHPPPGRGSFPVRLEAEFRAAHRAVRVSPGRAEAMGMVSAVIETPAGTFRIETPGKWHEQTGERPRFGSAFTYLNVLSAELGLLARTGTTGAWGFLREGKRVTAVEEFSIDALGPSQRRFRVVLADGRSLDGEASVELEASGPIEGRRRPGATVIVSTELGQMAGHLNDWDPGD